MASAPQLLQQPNVKAKQGQAGARARRTQHGRPWYSSENPWLWLSPGFLILFAYSMFPLLYNLWISFREWRPSRRVFALNEARNWETFFDTVGANVMRGTENALSWLTRSEVSLGQWQTTFDKVDPRIFNALSVTFTYVFWALIIQLLLGLLIALLLDAEPFGGGLLQSLIILPMVTAPSVAGMIFRILENSEWGVIDWMLQNVGIITQAEPLLGGTGRNALAAVLLVDIWQWTPFFVLILLAGLKGVPHELLEASQVDGANWFQRFFNVKLPMLRRVLTIAVLFRLVDLFRVFDYIVIMTSGGPGGRTETLSFYGYVNTFQQVKWGYGAMLAFVTIMIVWGVAFLYQRLLKVEF